MNETYTRIYCTAEYDSEIIENVILRTLQISREDDGNRIIFQQHFFDKLTSTWKTAKRRLFVPRYFTISFIPQEKPVEHPQG